MSGLSCVSNKVLGCWDSYEVICNLVHHQKSTVSRYIDVKDPIGSKLLFLSPIRSRKGAYSLKTFPAETVISKGKQNL